MSFHHQLIITGNNTSSIHLCILRNLNTHKTNKNLIPGPRNEQTFTTASHYATYSGSRNFKTHTERTCTLTTGHSPYKINNPYTRPKGLTVINIYQTNTTKPVLPTYKKHRARTHTGPWLTTYNYQINPKDWSFFRSHRSIATSPVLRNFIIHRAHAHSFLAYSLQFTKKA